MLRRFEVLIEAALTSLADQGLRAALEQLVKRARHEPGCESYRAMNYRPDAPHRRCTCGLTDLLASLGTESKESQTAEMCPAGKHWKDVGYPCPECAREPEEGIAAALLTLVEHAMDARDVGPVVRVVLAADLADLLASLGQGQETTG